MFDGNVRLFGGLCVVAVVFLAISMIWVPTGMMTAMIMLSGFAGLASGAALRDRASARNRSTASGVLWLTVILAAAVVFIALLAIGHLTGVYPPA